MAAIEIDYQEGYLPVESTELYYREIGQGQAIVVMHGGPDFDHKYLLPELDRLTVDFRLIYYDQRVHGKSAGEALPQEVSIESDVESIGSNIILSRQVGA